MIAPQKAKVKLVMICTLTQNRNFTTLFKRTSNRKYISLGIKLLSISVMKCFLKAESEDANEFVRENIRDFIFNSGKRPEFKPKVYLPWNSTCALYLCNEVLLERQKLNR